MCSTWYSISLPRNVLHRNGRLVILSFSSGLLFLFIQGLLFVITYRNLTLSNTCSLSHLHDFWLETILLSWLFIFKLNLLQKIFIPHTGDSDVNTNGTLPACFFGINLSKIWIWKAAFFFFFDLQFSSLKIAGLFPLHTGKSILPSVQVRDAHFDLTSDSH